MTAAADGLRPVGPIDVGPCFGLVNAALLVLLRELRKDDWQRPTGGGTWTVHDVAAHLLDGDLRRLSFLRDGHPPPAFAPEEGLMAFLNRLNAEWLQAARRLSPQLLIALLAFSQPRAEAFFRGLEPDAPAAFAVDWAGDTTSPNWFDFAREYTEKWLHQAQIREATGRPLIDEPTYLHPVLDTFLRALPHAYGDVEAEDGAAISVTITGPAGGAWSLCREDGTWQLYTGMAPSPRTVISMPQDTAWRTFSTRRHKTPHLADFQISGDRDLAAGLLAMTSVMA